MYIEGATCIIRPVTGTAEDLEQILQVYRQCEDFLALGPVAQASLEMVQADLEHSRSGGGTFCGIYDRTGGQMMGIIDYVTAGYQGDPQLASLCLLMIGAPYRRQGLGAEVVRAFEDTIRQDGRARTIDSGVQVNNPMAIRFWLRMGYKICSEARDMQDGTVAYPLTKQV